MRVYAWLCVLAAAALAAMAPGAEGARILAIFPLAGRSHFIVTSSLARAMGERGHELVVVSPFKTPNPPANWTDVTISNPMESDSQAKMDFYTLGNMPPVTMLIFMWTMMVQTCTKYGQDPAFQAIIQDKNQHFDLVLIEAFFHECLVGAAHRFKAPLVQLSAFGANGVWLGDWVGNPTPFAVVPDPFLDYTDHMTFYERTMNTLLGTLERVGRLVYYMPRMEAAARKVFEDPTMPPIADIERDTALVLVNSHFTLTHPRPAVPAFVEVGGLHIQQPKPVPKELNDWLNGAPEGFIYFSMGSNLRSADMAPAKRDVFLKAFAAFPKLRILWKWEEDSLPGQPANVRLSKWVPQQDVLAHPKIRLFITHGGLMSTQEAAYHGVPVLGIPVFGDQRLNMRRAEVGGLGLSVPYLDVAEDTLLPALKRALETPSFRDNAKLLQRRFHDRPQRPMDLAVFWTEYVMRHDGAPHIRSAALELNWFQYLLFDVVAVLSVLGLVSSYISYRVLRAVCRRLCRSKSPAGKPSKDKQAKKKD